MLLVVGVRSGRKWLRPRHVWRLSVVRQLASRAWCVVELVVQRLDNVVQKWRLHAGRKPELRRARRLCESPVVIWAVARLVMLEVRWRRGGSRRLAMRPPLASVLWHAAVRGASMLRLVAWSVMRLAEKRRV